MLSNLIVYPLTSYLASLSMGLYDIVQGESSFLPPPQKNRVPGMGGVLELCFFSSPHVWDSVFLGVARRMSHPVYIY